MSTRDTQGKSAGSGSGLPQATTEKTQDLLKEKALSASGDTVETSGQLGGKSNNVDESKVHADKDKEDCSKHARKTDDTVGEEKENQMQEEEEYEELEEYAGVDPVEYLEEKVQQIRGLLERDLGHLPGVGPVSHQLLGRIFGQPPAQGGSQEGRVPAQLQAEEQGVAEELGPQGQSTVQVQERLDSPRKPQEKVAEHEQVLGQKPVPDTSPEHPEENARKKGHDEEGEPELLKEKEKRWK